MLPKRNKDPRKVCNLCPITLLCVEYKMLTKAFTLRLKEILPMLVHIDQCGFISKRFLGANVIDIQTLIHVMDTIECNPQYSIMTLDITKAFDSVDWVFLDNILQQFGFPQHFIRWTRVMHNNNELCILNNGHLSKPFFAAKGLPQGDSLSAYLFVLVIESLAMHIRANKRLRGVMFQGYEKKVSLVADDVLLSLIADPDNFAELSRVLEAFA